MYHQSFSRICSARFMHRQQDGTEVELDVLRLISFPEPGRQGPRLELRKTRNKAHANQVAKQLCDKVTPRDVRVYTECGDMTEGWVEVAAGNHNVCTHTGWHR
jgi:hypothetical protein